MKSRYQNRIELLQGTLDLLILQTLQWGPQHGYGISLAIRNDSGEVLQVEAGSLYPALHRLENRGYLIANWRASDTGREAKFYRLTRKGRTHLETEAASWERLTGAISAILRAAKEGTS